jgi:hypothetical protein
MIPLSKYRVKTSHNSFLPGRLQICTKVSVNQIFKDLENNYRGIELDVYQSKKKNNLIIKHGSGCWTTSVFFDDCLEVIKDYMDKNDKTTPIILFIENNIKDAYLEDLLVEKIINIFNSKVVQNNINPHLPENNLDKYRGKLLVVNKRTKPRTDVYKKFVSFSLDINRPYTTEETQYLNKNKLIRAYPKNTVFTKNFDFTAEWNNNTQYIAINNNIIDKYTKKIDKLFNNTEGYLPFEN